MKLRRFEFGISAANDREIEVSARRSDGTLFLKVFPSSPIVLDIAEADFKDNATTWQRLPHSADPEGISEVWNQRGKLYISSEAAITLEALEERAVNTIISVNAIGARARSAVTDYMKSRPGTVHVEAPIRDVLARHQDAASAAEASRAISAMLRGLGSGEKLLLHCLMGMHRSVAVAVVALVASGHFPDARAAFLQVQACRPIVRWNAETVEWLQGLGQLPPAPAFSQTLAKQRCRHA